MVMLCKRSIRAAKLIGTGLAGRKRSLFYGKEEEYFFKHDTGLNPYSTKIRKSYTEKKSFFVKT